MFNYLCLFVMGCFRNLVNVLIVAMLILYFLFIILIVFIYFLFWEITFLFY